MSSTTSPTSFAAPTSSAAPASSALPVVSADAISNTPPDVDNTANNGPALLRSYYRPMKLPWNISEFDGTNTTAYLRIYNLMAADCGLIARAKLDQFSAYCNISIISEVESLTRYDEGDWDRFEQSLKRYFFESDPQQVEYQIPYLRSLAERQKCKGIEGLKIYATQFKKMSKVLVRDGKLSKYGACAEFYGGLPDQVREDIQRRLNIDWTKPEDLDIDGIIQEVINQEDGKLERQRFLRSTHHTPPSIPTLTPAPFSSHIALQQEFCSGPAPKETPPQIDK